MPGLRILSDQELMDVAHQWRHLSLSGSSEALREATRHEAEVRRRFGVVDPHELLAATAKDHTQSETIEPLTIATATSEFIIATADVATPICPGTARPAEKPAGVARHEHRLRGRVLN